MGYFKRIVLMVCLCLIGIPAFAGEEKIRVVCDIWPPYQVSEKGKVGGFSTKVIEVVFKTMGVEVESLEAYPWKRVLYMIENDKTDAIFSANYTPERAEYAFYPEEEIVQSPWVVWSRQEEDFKYASVDDLADKKVGIVRGYSYAPGFMEFLKARGNFEESTNDETNFKKLNAGRIDVTVAEMGNGFSILKELGIKGVVPHRNSPIKTDGLYIMFNKKSVSQEFVKRFSDELKKFKETKVYQIWYDEYFHVE